jgi:hypothetical protein
MKVGCDRIIIAAEHITNKILANTWQETEYHSDVNHATDGAQIKI